MKCLENCYVLLQKRFVSYDWFIMKRNTWTIDNLNDIWLLHRHWIWILYKKKSGFHGNLIFLPVNWYFLNQIYKYNHHIGRNNYHSYAIDLIYTNLFKMQWITEMQKEFFYSKKKLDLFVIFILLQLHTKTKDP